MSAYEAMTALELGGRGRLRGAPFALAGRTCVRSTSGGVWNEWTVRFDDGRALVLAEARGTFTLFTERALAPAWDALSAGAPLDTGFLVVERGEATRVARWGDVDPAPKSYRYADLSSRAGESATLDYGEKEPRAFVGARVALRDLGLSPRAGRRPFFPAPACKTPKGLTPVLDVGDEGTLDGTRFAVLGILQRSIRIEGERYTWEEYLLYDPAEGFRWLVVSDGHWNLVEAIEPGLVAEGDEKATFGGETYKAWSAGKAKVEWASGELPWEVAIGDVATVRDYVRAPHMLSFEGTPDEVAWSRGTYLPHETVARAFRKGTMPKPVGRAPNQPRKT